MDLSSLTYIKGGPIDAEAIKGSKVLVLEMWATWCPPCRQTIPHLSEIQHKYPEEAVMIGITTEDNAPQIKQFVKQMGDKMEYVVAIDDGRITNDLMGRYKVRGIPHAFVFDKDFNVAWQGHPADPQFEQALGREVARLPVTAPKPAAPAIDPKGLSHDQLAALTVKDLKGILAARGIDYADCIEKADLIKRLESQLTGGKDSDAAW